MHGFLRTLERRTMASSLSLLLGQLYGCAGDPANFVETLAAQECDFVARCTPVQFERRCRACRRHEECKQGACDLSSGRCQDPLGRPLPGRDHLAPCTDQEGCGGYVCQSRYVDAPTCVQERRASRQDAIERFSQHEQDPATGCAFPEALAQECLRAQDIRACSAPAPAACELALRDCR